MVKKIIGIVSFFLLFMSLGHAAQWQVDKEHAEVRFEIQHIFSTVTGLFLEFDGDIRFDPDQLGKTKISFSVNTKSINTHNNKRDTHLRSKDFFETGKYPQMQFVSKKINQIKDGRYTLEGDLTIKDVTRPVRVEFDFFGPTTHPFNKKTVSGFETRFEINRLDYNVGDGRFVKMGVVQDKVNIFISFEAFKK